MRQVHVEEINEEIAFTKRAAKRFANNKELYSYTDAEIKPGCFLGLRWGLGGDCVAVLKLDEYHEPKIYAYIVGEYKKGEKDED
jgi:hypothetical protein